MNRTKRFVHFILISPSDLSVISSVNRKMKGPSFMEKKQVKYEAAVAAFIKENKPKGTVVYDDLANQLATPYTLDAEAMEKLIQKLKMLVSAWSMKMETQVNIA